VSRVIEGSSIPAEFHGVETTQPRPSNLAIAGTPIVHNGAPLS